MSITPEPPLKTCEGRLKHGSILNGNIWLRRVSSQWKSTGIGILAGAGGTYLIMPEPEPVVRAPTDAEIAALIAANPSLIPEPLAPVLEIPTEEEALAAYRKAYARNPLRTGRGEADVTLALGECDENASGPGVSCVAAIKRNPNAAPLDRVVGFAKSASGEWVATNY